MGIWEEKIVQQSCCTLWFTTWPWLHYPVSDPDDVVFCHVCVTITKHKGMDQGRGALLIALETMKVGLCHCSLYILCCIFNNTLAKL